MCTNAEHDALSGNLETGFRFDLHLPIASAAFDLETLLVCALAKERW